METEVENSQVQRKRSSEHIKSANSEEDPNIINKNSKHLVHLNVLVVFDKEHHLTFL